VSRDELGTCSNVYHVDKTIVEIRMSSFRPFMKMQEYVENWLKTQKCVLMQEYARICKNML